MGQDNDNYKLSLGEITVTIAPATITVTPKAGQTMTYGDTVPALDYTSSGHIGTEIPAFEGALGSSGTDAGTHEITQGTLKLVDNGNFMANNYKIQVAPENVIIRKKDLLVTAQDQSIVYGQKLDQTKYIIGELVEGDTAIVTLTPSTTKVTTAGVVEPSVLICNASGENVTENYAVTLGAGKLVIKPDTSKIDDLTTDNVTSADVENIKAVQDMLKNADSVKEEWKAIGEKCEALLEKIKAVQDAADTDTIQNAEGVTAENVKLDDKKALEDAVTDLKQVLEDNGGNYTEQEKKAIEDEIQRIEDAMGALENVEDVTETITQLPETVEPDDEAAVEKILDAKEAYDALTDHEKSLVEESAKKKLDDLVAALTDYAIIKGDSGKWTKGSNYGLSFTANGPLSKFVGIEVDGKKVDEKHYEVKSGSTIITMKRSYLKNLSAGKHTIKVLYTDGETSGTFHIQEPSTIPETGDDSNIMLYGSMFTISLAAIVVLLLNSKKRKQGNA